MIQFEKLAQADLQVRISTVETALPPATQPGAVIIATSGENYLPLAVLGLGIGIGISTIIGGRRNV